MGRTKVGRAFRDSTRRRIYKAARKAGWETFVDGNGHVAIVSPAGRRISISTSAGGWHPHGTKRLLALARREGLDV